MVVRSLPTRKRGLKFCNLKHINMHDCRSLPTRKRGLKSHILPIPFWGAGVASYAEAWIEIIIALRNFERCLSLPTRKRGLKWWLWHWRLYYLRVASYAEAWIEIAHSHCPTVVMPVASYAEAWIEISVVTFPERVDTGRFLRGSVD